MEINVKPLSTGLFIVQVCFRSSYFRKAFFRFFHILEKSWVCPGLVVAGVSAEQIVVFNIARPYSGPWHDLPAFDDLVSNACRVFWWVYCDARLRCSVEYFVGKISRTRYTAVVYAEAAQSTAIYQPGPTWRQHGIWLTRGAVIRTCIIYHPV